MRNLFLHNFHTRGAFELNAFWEDSYFLLKTNCYDFQELEEHLINLSFIEYLK